MRMTQLHYAMIASLSSRTSLLGQQTIPPRPMTPTSSGWNPTRVFGSREFYVTLGEVLSDHSSCSSREIPYDDFQDHLRGRYILSPSRLYATARIAPDKQSYEIPLAGDFVTIAVVAERGPIRTSRAPVTVTGEDDAAPGGSDDEYADVSAGGARVWQVRAPDKKDKKGKGKEEGFKRKAGKKYVNLKLVDFGARSASSASGGKAVIRGDAQLSLLLFEADECEIRENLEGKKEKVYRGGSRGAFEKMARLREGAVVALLNPRILKPFQVRLYRPVLTRT